MRQLKLSVRRVLMLLDEHGPMDWSKIKRLYLKEYRHEPTWASVSSMMSPFSNLAVQSTPDKTIFLTAAGVAEARIDTTEYQYVDGVWSAKRSDQTSWTQIHDSNLGVTK